MAGTRPHDRGISGARTPLRLPAFPPFADSRSVKLMGRDVPITDVHRASPKPPQSTVSRPMAIARKLARLSGNDRRFCGFSCRKSEAFYPAHTISRQVVASCGAPMPILMVLKRPLDRRVCPDTAPDSRFSAALCRLQARSNVFESRITLSVITADTMGSPALRER